ncbi:MAG: helix-turn-helix domain-containing protein [Candidatus Thorarchaeota archaeon]|jgi:predicted transcriptional regulator
MTVRDQTEGLFARSFEKPSDFLCCAFGLRSTEIDVYFSLISGPKTVEEIRAAVGTDSKTKRLKDRTTIQRVLKKLYDNGLVIRESEQFDRGGYYYVYSAVSTEDVRQRILAQLEIWYETTRRFLLQNWSAQPQ